MKVKQTSQWLHKNSKIKYLIRLLIIAAVAWVLRFWEFEERRNRNYYEYDIICKDKWKCTKYMEILELDLYAESAYYGKV